MQLGLLKLNAGIGRALEHEAALQRENSALSVENSEVAAGDTVELQAAHMGMQLVPAGALRFLSAQGSEARDRRSPRAVAALSARRRLDARPPSVERICGFCHVLDRSRSVRRHRRRPRRPKPRPKRASSAANPASSGEARPAGTRKPRKTRPARATSAAGRRRIRGETTPASTNSASERARASDATRRAGRRIRRRLVEPAGVAGGHRPAPDRGHLRTVLPAARARRGAHAVSRDGARRDAAQGRADPAAEHRNAAGPAGHDHRPQRRGPGRVRARAGNLGRRRI